jgi:hypothetical protein
MKTIQLFIIMAMSLVHGLYLKASNIKLMQGSNLEDQLANISRLTNPEMISKYFFITLQMHKLFSGKDAIKFALSQKIVSDIAFFHGKIVATLTQAKFFSGETSGEYTNLDTFISPVNETRLLTSIRFFENGAAGDVDANVYTPGLIIPTLQNATFTILQNNNIKIKKYPLFEAVQAVEQFGSGIIVLEKPVPWVDQQPFEIQVDFAIVPVANAKLLLEVRGLGLI